MCASTPTIAFPHGVQRPFLVGSRSSGCDRLPRRIGQIGLDRFAFLAQVGAVGKLQRGVERGQASSNNSSSLVISQLQTVLDNNLTAREHLSRFIGVRVDQQEMQMLQPSHPR